MNKSENNSLLIIDDSIAFLNDVESLLSDKFTISKASSAKEGIEALHLDRYSAVLLDLKLPDMFGVDVLNVIHEQIDPYLPVIIVSDLGDVEIVAKAMREGAYDFIQKDFETAVLIEKIVKALERRSLEIRVQALQTNFAEMHDRFICISEPMRTLNIELTRIAKTSFNVLIQGETGVGKDLIAYEIHRRSDRRDKPFVCVSIGALSESLLESELFGHERGAFSGAEKTKIGKFESADGGSIYVPEISSLSEKIQLKLLHFVQYHAISKVGQDPRKKEIRLDVRMILATNENLLTLIDAGKFRLDFYHRVLEIMVTVPPLRQRKNDIVPLAEYFIQKYSHNALRSLSTGAIEKLQKHSWNGNVRELENCIKQTLAFSDRAGDLDAADFILHSARSKPSDPNGEAISDPGVMLLKEAEIEFRKSYFRRLVAEENGNIREVAKRSGLTPQGVRKILKSINGFDSSTR